MKELKLYQCELCRTQYADKNEAKQCEQYHARDLEIDGWSYRGMNETTEKFPVKIWVKSKNGEERMYRL
nr:MAG TPA: Monocytic leukemia zinc finger protein finger, acetyl transferase, DNA [Caudoviricetes sp.]